MTKQPGVCDRCHARSFVSFGSWFNDQMICLSCYEKEQSHPQLNEAKAAEMAAVRSGNNNFHGIGLPEDLSPDPYPHKIS